MTSTALDRDRFVAALLAMTLSFCRHPHRRARLIGRDPLLHHWAEVADQTLDRPGRGVAEGADRMALDLTCDLIKRVDLGDLCPALNHACHDTPHPPGTLTAWRALAAAFVHVELRQSRDRLDDVGGLVHHDHCRGAKSDLRIAQRVD